MNQHSSEMKQALTHGFAWIEYTKHPRSQRNAKTCFKYEFLDFKEWSQHGKTYEYWNPTTQAWGTRHFSPDEIQAYFTEEMALYERKRPYPHHQLILNVMSRRAKHFTGKDAKNTVAKKLQPQVPVVPSVPEVPETMAPPAREKVSTYLHEELQKSLQRLATAQQEVKVWEQAIRIAEGA
tara:strand:+ start:357 stop:896 length:540 start_codon:yes stop_codon:yes gene_type:complete